MYNGRITDMVILQGEFLVKLLPYMPEEQAAHLARELFDEVMQSGIVDDCYQKEYENLK